MTAEAPTLLLLIGPPAVGKMAVGHEIAERTGLRLFHNHLSIEPALRFFDFGTPSFFRLVEDFRRGVFEEVARSDLPGLIFTYVWAFNLPTEAPAVESLARVFRDRGGPVFFVELEATLAERLRRNDTELRLAEKPSKRDVEESRRRLLENEEKYQFNSTGEYDDRDDWFRIENTNLAPQDVAELVIEHFGLRRLQTRPE